MSWKPSTVIVTAAAATIQNVNSQNVGSSYFISHAHAHLHTCWVLLRIKVWYYALNFGILFLASFMPVPIKSWYPKLTSHCVNANAIWDTGLL